MKIHNPINLEPSPSTFLFFNKLFDKRSDVHQNTEEKICRYFCSSCWKKNVITLHDVFQLDAF